MIDIEKCKEEFLRYVRIFEEEYEDEDEYIGIERKKLHSIRVMERSKDVAKALKLNEEQIELAELIGLLHDIGRFEQYTRNGTYLNEMLLDHAKLGADILFKEGLIRKFIEDEKYDKIIELAIINHNKYKISEGLNKEELLFSKIIRDADKLDILYEGVEIYWKSKKEKQNLENSKINVKIGQLLKVERPVKRCGNERNDTVDGLLILLSYIYDINFRETLVIINEKDYVNKIFSRFEFKEEETKKQIENIKEILLRYIKIRLRKI